MRDAGLEEKLATELSASRGKGGVFLIRCKPEDYRRAAIAAASVLTRKMGLSGAYVTLSRPFKKISEDLSENGADTAKIFFIDGSGSGGRDSEKCKFLEGESLTELSLAISSALGSRNPDFYVIDSITTMLIYNDDETVQKFVHYLSSKVQNMGKLLVLISVEEEKSNRLVPALTQFCDKVIHT
ncbi:MAG: ATPase domain-containing protein [Candidatus Micrarchaeia archaeon]|jgi:KaiC/GvpD/RAD55 family RecA-like ATPase